VAAEPAPFRPNTTVLLCYERLDPELLTFSDGRAAQKARYGGELYPAEWPADADGRTYLDFFQRDRSTQQKGIIAIDLTGLP
jgi:hypothetical protein